MPEGAASDSLGAPLLAREIAFYEANRSRYTRAALGKFVLIKGDTEIGIYDRAEDAYAEGARRFGNQPMLLREITLQPKVFTAPALFSGLMNAKR